LFGFTKIRWSAKDKLDRKALEKNFWVLSGGLFNLRVLTDFCDHNSTVVALSPFGLFPAVSSHGPAWLDCMDHLRELLTLAEPLDVTQTLARYLNVVFTLQGLRYNTATIIGQRLEASR
jgi:hypothetical protein